MGESKWKTMAETNTILRCLVGSEAYGLASQDGGSDRDEKGVCIETFEAAFPLFGEFEQYEFRTAREREGGTHNAPSQPGDLDLTIYSLRKFLRLACGGNPNVIELLFIKGDARIYANALGLTLQDMAPLIIARESGKAYLGYMNAQKQRLLSERGQMRTTRTELIEKFGYDVKYASHVLRLGFQGVELLETGRLALPIAEPVRSKLLEVKAGEWGLNDVLQVEGELETKLKALISDGPLQDKPQVGEVESWMQDRYFEWWKAERYHRPQSTLVH